VVQNQLDFITNMNFGILKTDMALGLQKLAMILENKVSLN